jgi:hypothetical protein
MDLLEEKSSFREWKEFLPVLTLEEIDFHYKLVESTEPIKLHKIHPTLRKDLILFLQKNSKAPKKSNSIVPKKFYKLWIKKIDEVGLDYGILFKKTN